jgi:DedD protein
MAKLKPSVRELKEVPADPVLEARVRAKRRLVGAAILLSIGLIAFPIVFQTQPRPVDLAIPITTPEPEKTSTSSSENKLSDASSEIKPSLPESRESLTHDIVTETLQVSSKSISSLPPTKNTKNAQASDEIKLKDSSSVVVAKEPKFVVQAGAFTDVKSVRELRRKIEATGLKTYTQEVQIKGETKIRVRLGPFATREEAAKAQKKLKTLGLSPALFTL